MRQDNPSSTPRVTPQQQEDFSSVQSVGLDKTASRREHNYISLFHDLEQRRLLFAYEGREKAVDQVRKQEVKTEPLLKKTRYLWLHNEANRTQRQREHFDGQSKSQLKTAHTSQIKTIPQKIYQQCTTITEAEDVLNR